MSVDFQCESAWKQERIIYYQVMTRAAGHMFCVREGERGCETAPTLRW